MIKKARDGKPTSDLEEQCTGGVLDWGWHYPEWMIGDAADIKQKTGRYPHPDEIAAIPDLWRQDIDQWLALEAHHTYIPSSGEDIRDSDGPPEGVVDWRT